MWRQFGLPPCRKVRRRRRADDVSRRPATLRRKPLARWHQAAEDGAQSHGAAMDTSPPLSSVIAAVVHNTPDRVWAILAAITVLGLMQWREHRMSRGRLLVAPLALGAYSLWGATSALGAAALPAWLGGLALTLLASQSLGRRRAVEIAADGRFVLEGSPWP